MKRNIGKKITGKFRQLNEDMRELQKQLRHQSVYKRQGKDYFSRRPKHVKNNYIGLYQ